MLFRSEEQAQDPPQEEKKEGADAGEAEAAGENPAGEEPAENKDADAAGEGEAKPEGDGEARQQEVFDFSQDGSK